jgi:hypothetical protein
LPAKASGVGRRVTFNDAAFHGERKGRGRKKVESREQKAESRKQGPSIRDLTPPAGNRKQRAHVG